MKPEMRALYDDAILQAIAPRYGVAPEAVRSLGGFESFVHAYERDGRAYILKITHTLARTPDVLMGELDWLAHLADHGVAVARPVPSATGALIETTPGREGTFLAIAYDHAPGEHVSFDKLTPALNRAWGRLLGQMHALTRAYRAPDPNYRRADWHEALLPEFCAAPPADHAWFVAHMDGLRARLEALPRSSDAFGLVHGDLHFGNLLWTGERLTAIDFDDAHHTWFANDLAIAFYYVVQHAANRGLDPAETASAFLPDFLAGYASAHALDPAWLAHFPLFLAVRRAVLYAALCTAFPDGSMPDRERGVVARLRRGIEADAPVVALDFSAFAPHLRGEAPAPGHDVSAASAEVAGT